MIEAGMKESPIENIKAATIPLTVYVESFSCFVKGIGRTVS
jgi:hypothetical protein